MTTNTKSSANAWAKLTWDDLNAWAGSTSVERGRSYQRGHHVRQLALSPEGVLLATVQGTERYATRAELRPDASGKIKPVGSCTCPVGSNSCKHAVAVVLAYLDALKKKTPVPAAAAKDPRWQLLANADAANRQEDADEETADEEDADEEFAEDEEPAPIRSRPAIVRGTPTALPQGKGEPAPPPKGSVALRAYLEAQPPGELVNLLSQLAAQFPEVRQQLEERRSHLGSKGTELLKQARKELKRATAVVEDGDYWNDGYSIPDYSGLRQRLASLLASGQYDALLGLGQELLERGTDQIEQSQDEGETGEGIADCLRIIFQAVPQSSLSNPQKLLYAIDLELQDEYDLCQNAAAVIEAAWSQADWSAVAEELAERLQQKPARTVHDFHTHYQRQRLCGWLLEALERAGRGAEVLAVCEAEAKITGDYNDLVKRLLDAGRLDDAERWAVLGIAQTSAKYPGSVHRLEELLRQIAERRQDWPHVAAFYAEEFFQQPSVHRLDTLLKAAAKVGCEAAVRAAALQFLETDVRPQPASAAPKGKAKGKTNRRQKAPSAWPLPAPLGQGKATGSGQPSPRAAPKPRPHYDVLLDLAIREKRPEDVLAWYGKITQQNKERKLPAWHGGDHYAAQVADAVAATYPDQALALYRQLAEAAIHTASPSGYERALPCLRKMRDLWHALHRTAEWQRYLTGLRETHHRKRRLLELLDGLAGRPIIEQ